MLVGVGACTLIFKDAFGGQFFLSAPRFATGSAPITQADCLLPVLIFGKCSLHLGMQGADYGRGETGKALPISRPRGAQQTRMEQAHCCAVRTGPWSLVPGRELPKPRDFLSDGVSLLDWMS